MTDKTDSKEREALRSIGEEQAFEAWFKVDCPVEGANAKIAAKAAWKARASLAANAGSEPVAPEEAAEQFIQTTIDHAPEPFRRLGYLLARVLDEDQWASAQRLIISGLIAMQEGRDIQGDIDHYNQNIG